MLGRKAKLKRNDAIAVWTHCHCGSQSNLKAIAKIDDMPTWCTPTCPPLSSDESVIDIIIDMTIDDMPTWCTPACPPLSSDLSQRHKVHPSLRSGCAWSTKTGHTVQHLRCQLMWLVRVPPGLRLGQTRETLHPVKHLRCPPVWYGEAALGSRLCTRSTRPSPPVKHLRCPPVWTVRVHWARACAPDQRDPSPGEAHAVLTDVVR